MARITAPTPSGFPNRAHEHPFTISGGQCLALHFIQSKNLLVEA